MSAQPMEAGRACALLRSTAASVFADMAFLDLACLDGAPDAAEAEASDARSFRTTIDALKPTSCRIELAMTDVLRDRIAETLIPDRAAGDAGHDAVLEILNVIAGLFLRDYFGAETEVKLEFPQMAFGSSAPDGTELCSFLADVEGETISLRLSSVRYRY